MLCSADSSLRHLGSAVIAAEHALQVKEMLSGGLVRLSTPSLPTSHPCTHYIPHHPKKAKKEEKHFRENEATCPKLKNRGLLFSQDGEIVCSLSVLSALGALYLKSTHISKMNMFSPCKQKLVRHVRL